MHVGRYTRTRHYASRVTLLGSNGDAGPPSDSASSADRDEAAFGKSKSERLLREQVLVPVALAPGGVGGVEVAGLRANAVAHDAAVGEEGAEYVHLVAVVGGGSGDCV